MKKYILELSTEMVNIIAQALNDIPHKFARPVLDEMDRQVAVQNAPHTPELPKQE